MTRDQLAIEEELSAQRQVVSALRLLLANARPSFPPVWTRHRPAEPFARIAV